MNYVDKSALQQNIDETKKYVKENGGHTIKNDSSTFASQPNLKFSGFDVTNDSTNKQTVVNAQCITIETESEWDSLTEAQKDDPNTYYFLPWK